MKNYTKILATTAMSGLLMVGMAGEGFALPVSSAPSPETWKCPQGDQTAALGASTPPTTTDPVTFLRTSWQADQPVVDRQGSYSTPNISCFKKIVMPRATESCDDGFTMFDLNAVLPVLAAGHAWIGGIVRELGGYIFPVDKKCEKDTAVIGDNLCNASMKDKLKNAQGQAIDGTENGCTQNNSNGQTNVTNCKPVAGADKPICTFTCKNVAPHNTVAPAGKYGKWKSTGQRGRDIPADCTNFIP